MDENAHFAVVGIFVMPFVVGGLCVAIGRARRKDPGHVYTLWFVFSLALVVTAVLSAVERATRVTHACGLYGDIACDRGVTTTPRSGNQESAIFDYAWTVLGSMMSFRDEFSLVGLCLILLILPQLLSYLISGLFGCGSPPRFVIVTARLASWSVIKFFAALAGIVAGMVPNLVADALHESWHSAADLLGDASLPIMFIYGSILMITCAFVALATYLGMEGRLGRLADNPRLGRFHRFMTRHHPALPQAPASAHLAINFGELGVNWQQDIRFGIPRK